MPDIRPGQRWRNRERPWLLVAIVGYTQQEVCLEELPARTAGIGSDWFWCPHADFRALYTLEDPNADT